MFLDLSYMLPPMFKLSAMLVSIGFEAKIQLWYTLLIGKLILYMNDKWCAVVERYR